MTTETKVKIMTRARRTYEIASKLNAVPHYIKDADAAERLREVAAELCEIQAGVAAALSEIEG